MKRNKKPSYKNKSAVLFLKCMDFATVHEAQGIMTLDYTLHNTLY